MTLHQAYEVFKYWEESPPTHLLVHALLKGLSKQTDEESDNNLSQDPYRNAAGDDWREELGDPTRTTIQPQTQPQTKVNGMSTDPTPPELANQPITGAKIPDMPDPVVSYEDLRNKQRERQIEKALKKAGKTRADFSLA